VARPRSALAHKKVLDAAVRLFALQGIEATSMDAITEASGVSKATIYKHWQDKDALVLEVVGYLHGLDEEPPTFDSGDLRADFIAQLRYQPAADRQAMREKITPHLMAYASRNRALGTMWRARIVEPRRAALIELVQRGQKRGELVAGIDLEVAIALLFGPMLYRNVFVRSGGKDLKDLEVYVTDAFLGVFGVVKRKGR
jgi:AcrR family transcriptional regulator